MGSFISTIGNYSIPEDKLQEFEANVLHVLDIGGMMRLEVVNMFDTEVYLMTKSSVLDDNSGRYWASYNYFEEDMWETMGYNPKKHYVYSNKLGWYVFNVVRQKSSTS